MTQSVRTTDAAVDLGSHPQPTNGVERLRERLSDRLTTAETKWKETVQRDVFGALRGVTDDLIAAQAAAADKFREHSENREKLRTTIQAYRRTIAEEVLGKMGRFLRSSPPEARATMALFALLDTLADEVDSFPEKIEAPDSWDPYKKEPYDGWLMRLRKASIRVGRRLRRGSRSRVIPLRLLAAYHLRVRLARRFISRHKDCIRHLCLLHSDLEACYSQWTHAILDLEELVDDPAFYSPPDLPVAPDPGDDAESPADVLDRIRAVDAELGAGLQKLSSALQFEVPPDPHPDAPTLFEIDLRYAGTFMLAADDRSLPSDPYLPSALVEADQKPWTDWLEGSRNRIRINWHLLNLRSVLVGQIESLAERAADQTVRPLTEVMSLIRSRLTDLKERLEATFDKHGDDSETSRVLADLQNVGKEVEAFVGKVTEKVGAFDEASDFLKGFGSTESDVVAKAFGQLPGSLRIRVSDTTPVAVRLGLAEYEIVDLRSIASRMLGLRYSDQVRRHSDKLRRTVTHRWIDVEQSAEVVRFGLSAARQELETGTDDDDRQTGSASQAHELAIEGFARAIEMAEADGAELGRSWAEFVHGVAGISLEDWVILHRQVLGAELADEWTGYRDRIRRGFQAFDSDIRRLASVARQKLEVFFRLGRRHAHSLIQRGQSVVGVGQAVIGKRLETIDAVGRWGELMQTLPLVYRRLFSFEPLSDASHMVNRSADLSVVRVHFERWLDGRSTNSMVLSSPAGSGRTSFLNVVEELVFGDADVRRISLVRRYESEQELAGEIAAALEIELDNEPTFQLLEEKLLARPKNRRPLVCVLDNIEHVLLRIPGGSRLLESLLIFFSRTDEAIYWISTINYLARHFLEKSLQIGGFIDFYGLDPFEKESMQRMLMARHRKSGLALKFVAPAELGAIMKQRLRRAKTEADRQAILSSAFFEKLQKESGQNLRLALFYWLRSIEFNGENDEITVRSVRTLSVDFLNDLDLRSAFSLKALLFHSTLTLDEHNRLFRMSDREGTMIMESLLNSGLIVPIGKKGFDVQARIETGARYKVHPLLVHPITDHLRGRHIIY